MLGAVRRSGRKSGAGAHRPQPQHRPVVAWCRQLPTTRHRDPTLGSHAGANRSVRVGLLPPGELQAWADDPSAAPHGGESIEDLLARVSRWLTTAATVGGSTVAVTHPAVIRAVLITALQAVPMAFWWIDTPPLTATLLHARSGRWTLRYVNSALEDR